MRLLSFTLRNYRIHNDLTLDLDHPCTLIGGPNECGKSTLVEALHRALFLKSKVTGDVQKGMQPLHAAGHPEVELVFSAGNRQFTVVKKFSGANGATRLVQAGGASWTGDEAESRLAAILRVEGVSGGRGVAERVAQQWSHLWVWQGQSGHDPSQHANLQRDPLLQRLQQLGGAAALVSDLDARLAAQFAAARAQIFTQAGKPKADSEVAKADEAAARATAERDRAEARVHALRDASRDFEDASQLLQRLAADLQSLTQQKVAVDTQLARVAQLRALESTQTLAASAAGQQHDTQLAADQRIREHRAELETLHSLLEPKLQETSRLRDSAAAARLHSETAAQAADQAATRARTARLQRDLAAAWITRFDAETRLQSLLNRETQVLQLRSTLATLRDSLSKLPSVTRDSLKKLHSLESDLRQAEAALHAMAANIELLNASLPVVLGTTPLAPGQSLTITETTDLTLGNDTRLRIHPGGGSRLDEARKQVQLFSQSLQERLDGLGLLSVANASEVLVQRDELATQIQLAESALTNLNPDTLSTELAETRTQLTAAVAEVERRSAPFPDFSSPASVSQAHSQLAALKIAVDDAELAEMSARTLRDAAAKNLSLAESAVAAHEESIAKQQRDRVGLSAQLQLLLRTHGEDPERRATLEAAQERRRKALADLEATQQTLNDLQPQLLEADLKRLQRALDQNAEQRRTAETRRAVALAALRSDGSEDPESDLRVASAQLDSALEFRAAVRRKADAFQLLDQLFSEEQRALSEQFTRPFATKISAYLQCLFGAGAHAAIHLNENAFSGLELFRPRFGPTSVPFDSLSGGAREQVAAAVRLAMAEVLAPDHDHSLPVVFDDAFAYSDPERVQTLQRMLDRAVANGLQLILLTCTPSDYSALGAHTLTLRPPPRPVRTTPSADLSPDPN